jgi:hypothetical protein
MQPVVVGPDVTTNVPFANVPAIDEAPQLQAVCDRPTPGAAPARTSAMTAAGSARRVHARRDRTEGKRDSEQYEYAF